LIKKNAAWLAFWQSTEIPMINSLQFLYCANGGKPSFSFRAQNICFGCSVDMVYKTPRCQSASSSGTLEIAMWAISETNSVLNEKSVPAKMIPGDSHSSTSC
jgi:hypothetical protein